MISFVISATWHYFHRQDVFFVVYGATCFRSRDDDKNNRMEFIPLTSYRDLYHILGDFNELAAQNDKSIDDGLKSYLAKVINSG